MGRSSIDGFMPEDADYEYVTEEGLFERGEIVSRSELTATYLAREDLGTANARPPATPREQKVQEVEEVVASSEVENTWKSACYLRGMVSATQHLHFRFTLIADE